MTFPVVPTSGASRIVSSANTSPSGTHTFPNLNTLYKLPGDLLIALVISYDGNSTNAEFSSWGGGFTEFVDQATTTTMGIGAAYKWSNGTETGTFTVTSADTSTNDSVCILISIYGAHASTVPEGGTIANATNAAANPGSLNPASWDAEDTLWIAVEGSGEDSTTGAFTAPSAAPANYGDLFSTALTADVVGGVYGSLAFRQVNAASEDVGTFTVDTSNARHSALLIAVRPLIASTPSVGDVPPAPLVQHAVEVIAGPYGHAGWLPVTEIVVPGPDTPTKSLVVQAQPPFAQQPAHVFVERPFAEALAVPGTPVSALVVRSVEPPRQPPYIFAAEPLAPAPIPIETTTVATQQLPPSQPFVLVSRTLSEPPSSEINPPRPTIVAAQQPARALPFAGVNQPRADAVVVAGDAPPRPVFAPAIQPFPATWKLAGAIEARGVQVAPSTVTPPRPTVVPALEIPQPAPFVSVVQTEVDPTPAPQVPPEPIIVAAQWPARPQPFVSVVQPRVFAAAPVVGETPQRSIVIGTPPPPPATWRLADAIEARGAQTPPPPTLDALLQWPRPTVVPTLQPPPVTDFAGVAWATVNETVYRRSIVVPAIQPPTPQAYVYVAQTETPPPPPPPSVPIRPVVVRAEPLPRPVQAPWVARTFFEDPKVPIAPKVVRQQPIPPQAPFISTPNGGRWGDPVPRYIQPQVNVDMSLPLRPNGWVRVAHGFAEALPLLYEGTIVGGTLEGALVSGGVLTGSAMGGTVQNGYVTGGRR